MDEHGGAFPETYEAVRALPGVGDYTAGAICSICFERPTPGGRRGNVLRVLSRVMEDGAPVTNQKTKLPTARRCFRFMRRARGKLTQALMELGAMVCVRTARRNAEGRPLRDVSYQTRTTQARERSEEEAKREEDGCLSGAGRMPSMRANCSAASNTFVCSTERANSM